MAAILSFDPHLLQAREAAAAREAAKPKSGPASDGRLTAACQEMESLFIYMMFQAMRATVQKSELIDGGSAEQLYTSMLDAEVSRTLAQAGGIGLAALLKAQLAK